MNNSAVVFQLDEYCYGIAHDKYQKKEHMNNGRVLLHLYEDEECTEPVINGHNKQAWAVINVTEVQRLHYAN